MAKVLMKEWKAQKNGQRREYYHTKKADSLQEAVNQ